MNLEARPFSRVRVTVLDAMGVGMAVNRLSEYPLDADIYDRGRLENKDKPITPVNSLVNASQHAPLDAPGLMSLGLDRLPGMENLRSIPKKGSVEVVGAYGVLTPTFKGNGSPEGHQGLMGHIVDNPYQLFDKSPGFPEEVVKLVRDTVKPIVGREVEVVRNTGTDDVGGIAFIQTDGIGNKHFECRDGRGPFVLPIYASSDSLIQIALHEGVVTLDKIKEIGLAVRKAVNNAGLRIARIIMRPFEGGPKPEQFTRISEHRMDFGVNPDKPTLLNALEEKGIRMGGVGKAASMLNFYGLPEEKIRKGKMDEDRMQMITDEIKDHSGKGAEFSFDNLVGLDELFGHRRNPEKYMEHVKKMSKFIAQAMLGLADDDLWILVADHGNDPTQQNHFNHTNEMVPIFVYSKRMKKAINLGVRKSYTDVAKTVAENFGVADKIETGESFLKDLL